MFLSSSPSRPRPSTKVQLPRAAMKRKFAWALAWIDLGLCLAIFTLVPHRSSFGWNNWIEKFIHAHQWEILLPLFLAVLIVSIGAYRIVDTFYKWPSDDR